MNWVAPHSLRSTVSQEEIFIAMVHSQSGKKTLLLWCTVSQEENFIAMVHSQSGRNLYCYGAQSVTSFMQCLHQHICTVVQHLRAMEVRLMTQKLVIKWVVYLETHCKQCCVIMKQS